ncbi:papain-like cysteine protease family protein [Burkholderia lata]|nr:papain-like cysteine protease family protein [Burkholderia lata]
MLQNFSMPNQLQDEWCWAAVSIALRDFYGRNGSAMTQCQVACKVLSNANCCASMADCNCPADLLTALTAAGVNAQILAGPLSAQDITNQLKNSRAIGVRIAWSSSNAHFVSVFGIYDTQTQGIWVDVGDPDVGGGVGTTSLDALKANYRSGGGVWTHTYLTA